MLFPSSNCKRQEIELDGPSVWSEKVIRLFAFHKSKLPHTWGRGSTASSWAEHVNPQRTHTPKHKRKWKTWLFGVIWSRQFSGCLNTVFRLNVPLTAEDLPLSALCLGKAVVAALPKAGSSPGTAPLLPDSAANTELPETERALAKLSCIWKGNTARAVKYSHINYFWQLLQRQLKKDLHSPTILA